MILDHVAHIGFIEVGAGHLRETIFLALVRSLWLGWERPVLLLRESLELVIGLAVIGDHALAKLLDGVIRTVLLGNVTEIDLSHASLRGLGNELFIHAGFLCRSRLGGRFLLRGC